MESEESDFFKYNLPKRPECSLDLYEPPTDQEVYGYVYHTGAWDAYTNGYLSAVKRLIEVVERDEFEDDTLGYPIFYLFRHYLELRMKGIIYNGEFLIPINDQKYWNNLKHWPKSHDIVSLWEKCKMILQNMYGWKKYSDLGDNKKIDYETMDHFIKKISQDKEGAAFRYPKNTKDEPLLIDEKDQNFLNISHFSDVVNWLSNQLDGISIGMDEYLDAKREFEEDSGE